MESEEVEAGDRGIITSGEEGITGSGGEGLAGLTTPSNVPNEPSPPYEGVPHPKIMGSKATAASRKESSKGTKCFSIR